MSGITAHSVAWTWFGLLVFCHDVRADDRLLMPATINDRPVRLALDTGFAGQVLIWSSVAEELGVAPADDQREIGPPPPGEIYMPWSLPAVFEIAGKRQPEARFSLYDAPPELRVQMDGLIGWAAVRTNVLTLRLARGEITLVDEPPDDLAGWLELKTRSDTGQLVIDLAEQVGSRTSAVLVDTGVDTGVHLSAERWRTWRQEHHDLPSTLRAYSTPTDGLVIREECWAEEIVLGPLVIRGVSVLEANASEQFVTGYRYAATLGLKALRRLDLVVDGRTGTAYARPLVDSPPPVQHNRLGAIFAPLDPDSDDLVARVAANSPAARAGIVDRDVLLQIDDLDVTPWKTEPGIRPLGRFWEKPAGTRYQLVMRRNRRPMPLAVELETILGPE